MSRTRRPRGNTELAAIMARWCHRCALKDEGQGCPLLFRAWWRPTEVIRQWHPDAYGGPACDNFEAADRPGGDP